MIMRTFLVIFFQISLGVRYPEAGEIWYVRPTTSISENGDGQSYSTAWMGLNNVVWGSGGIEAGDTLYVCGLHDTGASTTNLLVQASGRAGMPITISGDCPGDPGAIFRNARRLTSGWIGPDAYGAYAMSGVYGDTGRILYEDGELLTEPRPGLPNDTWVEGSFYHDAQSHVLYYRPTSGTAENHVVYTAALSKAVDIVNQAYITIENIELSGATTFAGVIHLNNADHIVVDNAKIRYGYFCVGAINDSDYVTIKNSEIHDCGSGIYTISSSLATQHDNWLVQGNSFYDIGKNKLIAGDHGDLHAIGFQGGSANVIEYNEGYDISGTGVTLYLGADQVMDDNVIRYNYFRDIASNLFRDDGTRQGREIGIDFHATMAKYSPDRNRNNEIYGNIIVRARRVGIYILVAAPTSGYTWNIHDNTLVRNGNSFEFLDHPQSASAGFIFQNNISFDPQENERMGYDSPMGRHVSHIWQTQVGSFDAVLMSNNLYWPDGINVTNTRFEWKNVDYPDFPSWIAAANATGAGVGSESTIADPMLVNPSGAASQDFAVTANSLAIDAGADTRYDTDFLDNPVIGLPDIGAFEFGCSFDSPTLSLGPVYQILANIVTVSYSVSITNNACETTSFDLVGSLDGLSGALSPQHLEVAAGDTGYATLAVDPDQRSQGLFNISVSAADSTGYWNPVTASAILLIDTVPPAPPADLSAVKTSSETEQSVRLDWNQGFDMDPGSGIESYRIYSDGDPIAEVMSLSYYDTEGASGVGHEYEVTSVDGAGHESPEGAFATIEPDTGGDASDTEAPSVAITSPTDGTTLLKGERATIEVAATDDVKVSKVEILINNHLEVTFIGTGPYHYNWNVPKANNKTYSVVARAYDMVGKEGKHEIEVRTFGPRKPK